MLRSSRWIIEILTKASERCVVISTSLDSLRGQASRAKVRSTIQRLGNRTNLCYSVRLTTCISHANMSVV